MHRHTNWNKVFPSLHLPHRRRCSVGFANSAWFHFWNAGCDLVTGFTILMGCSSQLENSCPGKSPPVLRRSSKVLMRQRPMFQFLFQSPVEHCFSITRVREKKLFWCWVKWQGRLYWRLLSRAEKWCSTLSARGREGIYSQGTEWGASVDGKSPWGTPKGGDYSNLT